MLRPGQYEISNKTGCPSWSWVLLRKNFECLLKNFLSQGFSLLCKNIGIIWL